MTGRLGEGRDLAKVDGEGAQPSRMDLALGLRIRQRRKAMGLSQTALAESVGITFQQIQKYERGFNRVRIPVIVGACSTRWWAPIPRDRGRSGA